MKVLYVVSGNKKDLSPFFLSQYNSLKPYLAKTNVYPIKGNGILGYLKNLSALRNKIRNFKPDLIHAHYGFSGLLSSLQLSVPVVTTFHGSDINNKINMKWSFLASILSKRNIFVNPMLLEKIKVVAKKSEIIPCGVNMSNFSPKNKSIARSKLGLKENMNYVLFSSSFNNPVKNYPLAKEAINKLNGGIKLIELKNYKVSEVNLLMNAVDLLLVTSTSETGPLVVKEAMSCNCPVVCTDVGDVKWIFGDLPGHFITSFDSNDIADKVSYALDFSKNQISTNGRNRIIDLGLDSETIANKIYTLYKSILKKKY